jgi:hypothetical protein
VNEGFPHPDYSPAGILDFGELSSKYPDKTSLLGQVFDNTINSYKLVWFLAILSLLEQKGEQ